MKSFALLVLLIFTSVTYSQPSFPGAEGFGANASGGRGGQVIYVTNLNPSGPGSLTEALTTPGKRYILFKVSGIIDAVADIVYGDVTIAGQSSPKGIIVRGILADEIFDTVGTADNIIIRHIRSRPYTTAFRPAGYVLDDALRLDGASNVMIDHCSFANAVDEAVQISNSINVTFQNSILAETIGEHFALGGMLLNYSTPEHPQDSITIQRNAWLRIGGRFPEISCETPYASSRPLHIEFSHNILWDQQAPMLYNSNIDPSAPLPKDSFFLRMNMEGNRSITRKTYSYGMFTHSFLEPSANSFFLTNNKMQQWNGVKYSDVDLFYCCNDFIDSVNRPNRDSGLAQLFSVRHPFPTLTPLTFGIRLYIAINGGAFPRDSMDRRILAPLIREVMDLTPVDSVDHYKDAFIVDYDTTSASYPSDLDGDGMPDWWELHHGSDPNVPNHNDLDLAGKYTIVPVYPNIELYLNRLSDSLVTRKSTLLDTASKSVSETRSKTIRVVANGRQLTAISDDMKACEMKIVDITGRTIYSTYFVGQHSYMLSRQVASGIYLVTLRLGDTIHTEKIRIE